MNEKPLYHVTYELTKDLYKTANYMFFKKRVLLPSLIYIFFSFITSVWNGIDEILSGRDPAEIIIKYAFIMTLMLCLLLVIFLVTMIWTINSHFKSYVSLNGTEQSIQFYEEKLICLNTKRQAVYNYEEFWKLERKNHVLFMFTGNRWLPLMIYLPLNGIHGTQDEQIEAFLFKKCINIKK